MSKITITKILIVFGILLMLAGIGTSASTGVDTASGIQGGTIFLFGALAYYARKTQRIKTSKKWLVAEIISLLIILRFTIASFLSGQSYNHPITYFFVPLLVWGSWFFIFLKRNNQRSIKNE